MRQTLRGGRTWGFLLAMGAFVLYIDVAEATCPYSIPVKSGGELGTPPGFIIVEPGATVEAFAWMIGGGDPTVGRGDDSGVASLVVTGGKTDHPRSNGDQTLSQTRNLAGNWGDGGWDGCLAGKEPGGGVMAAWITDDGGNYALLAVSGTAAIVNGEYNFDNITGGEVSPITGDTNDVSLAEKRLLPVIRNVRVGEDSCTVDIGAPLEAINYYDDQEAKEPYAGLLAFQVDSLTHRMPGGGREETVSECRTGCVGVSIPKDRELCWNGAVRVLARAEPTESVVDTIPGGCVQIAECTDNREIVNITTHRIGTRLTIEWETTSLDFQDVAVRGVRGNGGTLLVDAMRVEVRNDRMHYEQTVILPGMPTAGMLVEIECTRADGSRIRTPVAVD